MFSALLDNSDAEHPAKIQVRARDQFAKLVGTSPFLNEPRASMHGGVQVVIGIATYSLQDLQLLDEIVDSKKDWKKAEVSITVFDVMTCQSLGDVIKKLGCKPEDALVNQTPVLAVWKNRVLENFVSGEAGVRETLKEYGLLGQKESAEKARATKPQSIETGRKTGKDAVFTVKKGGDGKFVFQLVDPNGKTILTSRLYASKSSARSGIALVKGKRFNIQEFAPNENSVKTHFALTALNGRLLAKSQQGFDRSAIKRQIKLVARMAARAKVND